MLPLHPLLYHEWMLDFVKCFAFFFFSSLFFFFFFFGFFRAPPSAWGGSQARDLIGVTAAGHSHSIWAMSATDTTAHSNTRSLTHWVRTGIKPTTSWFLVRFVSTAPRWELLLFLHLLRWSWFFFLFLILLMWCMTSINLHILNHPCELGMNPTWSWCMIFFICCWICLAKILLKIFVSIFIKGIGL